MKKYDTLPLREVSFIKKNKDNWTEIEQLLSFSNPPPEKLLKAFDSLNNDLSYAQTYYPKSKLIPYLNGLCSELYHKIYKPKSDYSSIYAFFFKEVPLIAYQHRNYIYFSILFFLFSVALGLLSSHYDESFVRAILGDDYVNMTLDNIEEGNPTAVYKNNTFFGDGLSAFKITLNNIMVSINAFLHGLLAGFGSIYIELYNGVMVGAFLYLFVNEGVFPEAVKAIFIHGTIELFVITIAAASGILLGFSYLFPGSLSRRNSFLIKGKQAVKLLISTFPFFILAGTLEGFVTQYGNDLPNIFSYLIIIITLAITIYYYLILPLIVGRNSNITQYNLNELIDEF